MINVTQILIILTTITLFNCTSKNPFRISELSKKSIEFQIQKEINVLIRAVSQKDLKTYMAKMPEDFIIYDENGEIITREQQRQYVIRDWAIIERTLHNEMRIDSIDFVSKDSLLVYTFQKWKRLMYQRDGLTLDTVLTTQRHRELWKARAMVWLAYDVEELGGEVFINGQKYEP